ncbi:methyltransferase-like protein 16 homolog isoform X2 [Asparagus officinalis]|uniref:methyltransferase-like protein 16 homolog isoform X2 n=1 Tax=Asparagus officinalis TaxID=4686 RepID=UPI00098E6425|nr:methyltransferase-like protein 16 homolog isoform X2 [Asparagus officinalis]
MMSKKRRRLDPPSIHPRNKYSENPPDFSLLASLYPSFAPFVSVSSRTGRASIDWTDFNATRELTRALLHRDHGVSWWIPDGQLCPTVPNRSNYIHWIEDLLSSELIPPSDGSDGRVRGFDIGTGANCIYPLLGASLLGWSFVGSDVTDVALEWARKNVESNPHLSELIEIRNASSSSSCPNGVVPSFREPSAVDDAEQTVTQEVESPSQNGEGGCYKGPSILAGVVRDGEHFDFCMCNPPFFESVGEAGLNPRTSCGGTPEEMVCHGGERAFVTRIIEDSVVLKHSFRWFTSMIGRKSNLKSLISKLREVGVSVVKTTEFVQGKTCRWGLAWSFLSPRKKLIESNSLRRNNHSFMLEGRPRHVGAFQVLTSVESFFQANCASCKSDFSTFSADNHEDLCRLLYPVSKLLTCLKAAMMLMVKTLLFQQQMALADYLFASPYLSKLQVHF